MVRQNGHRLDKVPARTPAEGSAYYDHSSNENNSKKSAGNVSVSDITQSGDGVCSSNSSITPTKAKSRKSNRV